MNDHAAADAVVAALVVLNDAADAVVAALVVLNDAAAVVVDGDGISVVTVVGGAGPVRVGHATSIIDVVAVGTVVVAVVVAAVVVIIGAVVVAVGTVVVAVVVQ